MQNNFTFKEQAEIEGVFRLRFSLNDPVETIPFVNLLDEQYLNDFLHEIDRTFQTDQLLVVGSQLMKRLTNLLLVPALYSLAVFQKKVDIDPAGIALVPAMKKQKWMPFSYLRDYQVEASASRTDRNTYLEHAIHQMSHYVKTINAVAKVPTPLLWENVAVYVYKLYESKIQEADLNLYEQKEAWNDFAYLLQLNPTNFQERFNPLQRFYTNKIEVEGKEQPVRVRRTCCFNYETQGGKYCKGCPKSDVNKEACLVTKRHVMQVEMMQ